MLSALHKKTMNIFSENKTTVFHSSHTFMKCCGIS